jgi:hydroxyacylglutathione hydrolase
LRREGQATIPSTIGLEREINPFLRWDQPKIQQAMGTQSALATFTQLRRRKDHF